MSLTSTLYKLARVSGDARAVSKGPKAVGKRMARRAVNRRLGKFGFVLTRWPR